MKRLPGAVILVVLVWCVVGCGKRTPPGPPLAKVNGKVNLDGKPMAGGEVRFSVSGQPVKSIEIKDGAFSGEAHTGKNRVEVVWEKDGPPNPTDPKLPPIKVNVVDPKFSGMNSPFNVEVPATGASDLKFDVTSARK